MNKFIQHTGYRLKKPEIRIAFIILTIFTVVVLTGVFTYKGLKQIVSDVSHSSEPELRLMLTKQIVSNIQEAETSVRFFNLTHQSSYLKNFYTCALDADGKFEDAQNAFTDTNQLMLLKKIHLLTEEKYTLLNNLISFSKEDDISKELNLFLKKIDEEQYTKKEIILNKKKTSTNNNLEKSTLLERLFNKNKKQENNAIIKYTSEPSKHNDLKAELEKVNLQHIKKLRGLKLKEFYLTKKSEELTQKIKELEGKIESIEKKLIAKKIYQAGYLAKKTTIIVASFCITAGILLFIVSLVLINYLQKKRNYEKALNESKLNAENLARSKEIFLANMSHEIRTPMHAISGFTEQLLKTELQNQQKEQLIIVKKTTNHLLHIVNEILDYSKLESGKITFELNPFSPSGIIQDVIDLFRPLIKNGVIFKHNNNIDNSLIVNGDEKRLKQVLINIISNALKFTQKGEVILNAECIENENHFSIQIKVSDTGIGIPSNKLSEIFNEYEQASNSLELENKGTGLGLSITKKIIEHQLGSITLESEENKGTIVSITIPYKKASPELHLIATQNKPEELLSFKNLNVLVADDDEYNRKLLHEILKKWSISSYEVNNGKIAVEELKKQNYDLILMDVRMPVMNGIEAAIEIRKFNKTTPIIALTATDSIQVKEKCISAGINNMLSKPFFETDLLNMLTKVFTRDDEKNDHQIASNTYNDNFLELPISGLHYDLTELKKTCNNNDTFINEMIELFISSEKQGIEKIMHFYNSENWEAIEEMAHQMAPTCKQIKAISLYQLLKELEKKVCEEKEKTGILISKIKLNISELIIMLEKEINQSTK